MRVLAVIPARYESVRFPGKPLAEIAGKKLLEWVWMGTKSARLIERVVIATDDERICQEAQSWGADMVMTRRDHTSGTDRVAEAAKGWDGDWVLNVQGDEPLIEGWLLDEMIEKFSECSMATLCTPLPDGVDPNDRHVVKVVMDDSGRALYFSRAAIPAGFKNSGPYFQHMGIYAYRTATLREFVSLPPSSLEKAENLEQLRALQNGIAIQVIPTSFQSIGVDTPEDILKVEERLKQRGKARLA